MTGFYLYFFIILSVISIKNNVMAQTEKNIRGATGYDSAPFNCNTWKEVDIIWTDPDHPSHHNHAMILRPDRFIQAHRLKAGYTYRLNLRAFGMPNARVMITAIHPLTRGITVSKTSKPVIGIYSYKTNDVQRFLFKNEKGGMTVIHATPLHLFYVYSIKGYLPLNRITSSMKLLDKNNQFISLICPKGREYDCGKEEQPDKTITVHNIEVYRVHHYFVGKQSILVHNACESLAVIAARKFTEAYLKPYIDRVGTSANFVYNTKAISGGRSVPGAEEALMASIKDYNKALENILREGPVELISSLKLQLKEGSERLPPEMLMGEMPGEKTLYTENIKVLYIGENKIFVLSRTTRFRKLWHESIMMSKNILSRYDRVRIQFNSTTLDRTKLRNVLTEIIMSKIGATPTSVWGSRGTFPLNSLLGRVSY